MERKIIINMSNISVVSPVSQELFKGIDIILNEDDIYYDGKNHEYVTYLKGLSKSAFIDFFSLRRNKGIEFFGDYWHAHPDLYKECDIVSLPKGIKMKASEIWENDLKRIECLKKEYNIDILVIWEKEFRKDKEKTIQKCIGFLKDDTLQLY